MSCAAWALILGVVLSAVGALPSWKAVFTKPHYQYHIFSLNKIRMRGALLVWRVNFAGELWSALPQPHPHLSSGPCHYGSQNVHFLSGVQLFVGINCWDAMPVTSSTNQVQRPVLLCVKYFFKIGIKQGQPFVSPFAVAPIAAPQFRSQVPKATWNPCLVLDSG